MNKKKKHAAKKDFSIIKQNLTILEQYSSIYIDIFILYCDSDNLYFNVYKFQ